MSVPFRRIDFGGFMSWNTQPNCRALDNRRWEDLRPNFLSLFLSGCPDRSWRWSVTSLRSCQWSFFSIATALLSSFFLDLLVCCSSTWRCAYEHFSPNRQPLLVLKNKHSGGCHFSQNELLQVPSRWSLQGHRNILTTGTSSSGTSGFRRFSLTLLHERIRRRIWWCNFSTLIDIVTETAIVSIHTLPVGFPLPTFLQEFFVHAVLFPDSWPRRSSHNFHFFSQNSYFEFLAQYFSSP